MPKYAHVIVRLTEEDTVVILSRVAKALRRGGVSESIVEAFREEATAGDYDHLLQVVTRWVSVE